jgi:ATP-dependent Zn protease
MNDADGRRRGGAEGNEHDKIERTLNALLIEQKNDPTTN